MGAGAARLHDSTAAAVPIPDSPPIRGLFVMVSGEIVTGLL